MTLFSSGSTKKLKLPPSAETRGGAPIGAGGYDPPLFEAKGRGDKVNVENTKITTENISISVSQLQIKQRN